MPGIQGMPFAYGQTLGTIELNPAKSAPDRIVVLASHQIDHMRKALTACKMHVPAALIVIDGAPLSHTMISLLSLGIPIAILTQAQASTLPAGTPIFIDGGTGWISVSGEPSSFLCTAIPGPPRLGAPLSSADGQAVFLMTSISNTESAAVAVTNGAAGIGLVRSEYLQPADGNVPDTAFYIRALGDIGRAAAPLPVTVRLLDIAPDKHPPWLNTTQPPQSLLGLQGVRLYEAGPVRHAFQAQVEALRQLNAEYELSVLLPYITCVEEFRHWRSETENLLSLPMTVGAMAETPAAVLAIAELLEETNLVAIGCNDLMQCLYAADRDLAPVSHLLDPCQPAIFRFLQLAANQAGGAIDRVRLCGLLPQSPGILPILLGMGYRTFSVEPHQLPYLADIVRSTDTDAARTLASAVCAARDVAQVRALLHLPARPGY